jgi:hypothetical protein
MGPHSNEPQDNLTFFVERMTMQLTLEVNCSAASELAVAVDTALALVENVAAVQGMHGVLLTRHDYQRFTLEVSADVPFGLTIERDQCRVSSVAKTLQ